MAKGEYKYNIDTDDVPGMFKDIHKIAGSPPEVVYDILLNGTSPEDAVVKWTKDIDIGDDASGLEPPLIGSSTTADEGSGMSDEEAMDILRVGDVQSRL